MIVDMHLHWVPKDLAKNIRMRNLAPTITHDETGQEWLNNGGKRLIKLPGGFDDGVEGVLSMMDDLGVDHAVLSLSTIYRVECIQGEDALKLCQLFNDGMSRACQAHPLQLSGLAIIPATNLDEGLQEFERAMDLPGMVGVLLLGDGFLSLQRAQRFAPIFESANRRGCMVFIHYGYLPDDPTAPRVDQSDNSFVRIATLDFQARLSSNLVTLVLTDFLASYPDVIVVSHNLGGNIPFEMERMDHRSYMDQPTAELLPSQKFRAAPLLVDCNSFGPKALEMAVSVFGADKIVFGSDGSRFGGKWSVNAIGDAKLSESDKHAITGGNAAAALAKVRKKMATWASRQH